MTDERAMIFIDGQNMFHGQKRFGIRVDYIKLAALLARDRKLVGKYYYGSIPNNKENDPITQLAIDNQLKFYTFLERSGFINTILPLKIRSFDFDCMYCGRSTEDEKPVEKGADVALASDMLSMAIDGLYDVAILVSGDFDYHKAVEAIKKRKLDVEIAYFKNHGITPEFIKLANRFIDLETHASEIELIK